MGQKGREREKSSCKRQNRVTGESVSVKYETGTNECTIAHDSERVGYEGERECSGE
jgi:hypothetical protein